MVALVRRFRRWLARWAGALAGLVVLYLTPEPSEPPRHEWVCRGFSTDPTHTVYIIFSRDNTWLPNKYATRALLVAPNLWVWVNLDAEHALLMPTEPQSDDPAQFITETLAPDYLCHVPSSYFGHDPQGVIGPLSCAILAKRMINLQDRNVQTASDLLAALWRNRVWGQ